MHKRLIILSALILAALIGLSLLGYHSIQLQAEGLAGRRAGEFVAVAEQIRQDVKQKLDEFIQAEQQRPYTDYQSYYVPEALNYANTLVPSPLGGKLEHGLAYGHFQIEPDGSILTPNDAIGQRNVQMPVDNRLYAKAEFNRRNIKSNVLPALTGNGPAIVAGPVREPPLPPTSPTKKFDDVAKTKAPALGKDAKPSSELAMRSRPTGQKGMAETTRAAKSSQRKGSSLKRAEYKIRSLEQQEAMVVRQSRANVDLNVDNRRLMTQQQEAALGQQQRATGQSQQMLQPAGQPQEIQSDRQDTRPGQAEDYQTPQEWQRDLQIAEEQGTQALPQTVQADLIQADTVEVKIERFTPLLAPDAAGSYPIFGAQLFLLRRVQIEDKHFMQGFQFNEKKLLDEITKSASRLIREGMDFDVGKVERTDAAYAAILDFFGLGDIVLNLIDIDPHCVAKQIGRLRNWYFGIITTVFVAVMLGLASLWRNMRAQIKLARKKDDFISAVSHELRTPLTTIRMYTEMLEKGWIKSDKKRGEYYSNMRQESERLSRLIENVLDFSRIQKGRKKYTFTLGNLNDCVSEVVEMMKPYAEQNGFTIIKDFTPVGRVAFDRDAVMQIVVNLLDNAVKYARNAKDKTILVRTAQKDGFVLIEVQDHGPGVPHRQRKKVFDEFYRCGAESRRETTGTGLGLALVKKFAQAHSGFVEILTTKPTGAIFRVALSAQS